MVDEINTDLDENENDSVPVDLAPSTSVQSKRRSSASILIGMFLTMKSPLTTTIVQYSTVLTVLLIIVYSLLLCKTTQVLTPGYPILSI